MTDYTPEELREWCRLAGLVWMPGIEAGRRDDAWVTGNPFHDGGAFWLAPDHPALISYVADLLVAMVRERGCEPGLDRALDAVVGRAFVCAATPAQRCRAAAEALGDE